MVNLVLLLVACLLGISVLFAWRLGMITYRVEQAVVAVSDDLKEVTGTAAQISRDVREIREELKEVKVKVEQSLPVEELDSLMDAALQMGRSFKADSPSLDADAEREIKYLLRALLLSGMKYERRGKERPISLLYATLYAKYKSLRGALASAEDFVDKVATKSVLGRSYYIVDKEGNRHALRDWMLETLEKRRANGEIRNLNDESTTEAE